MLLTSIFAFLAGVLTAFAPCVLPLLPIILGGSVTPTTQKNRKRPYIIVLSLIVSIMIFTLLLKISTQFIGVDPKIISIASGVLIIVLGIFMLFPTAWSTLMSKMGIENRNQQNLARAVEHKNGTVSAILTGAALGPVFSSCSPTYAYVIATVLPSEPINGFFLLTVYSIGLGATLLAIALIGRKLLSKLSWATNPFGIFQKVVAVLFILVGVFVATGTDKKVQTFVIENNILNFSAIEQQLVPKSSLPLNHKAANGTNLKKFNVEPYAAPELAGIKEWINSDPLTLAQLKGKVVLIDFWTYSCINCKRTQPFLNAWYEKYHKAGFEIIGVHAPEFAFEQKLNNVQDAAKEANIQYPIGLDNAFTTWNAYQNQYWPAKYLIDKNGNVRFTHFGEGEYDTTEKVIQDLLNETGSHVTSTLVNNKDITPLAGNLTPETYLGAARAQNFANAQQAFVNKSVDYTMAQDPQVNQWGLTGKWTMSNEGITSDSATSELTIHFIAKNAYLVITGKTGSVIDVSDDSKKIEGGVDLKPNSTIVLDADRLYHLIGRQGESKEGILRLRVPAGVSLNAFTFG